MRLALIGLGALLVAGAFVAAFLAINPFADESDPTANLGLTGTACERLAGLAGNLAENDDSAADFLRNLGLQAGGIRKNRRGLADLLRGGHNRIPGKGFRKRYDDGTRGQVRHFSGIAVATLLATGNPTLWISRHLRHDVKGSADDNLTEQGVEFATLLMKGELSPDESEDWVLAHLCRRKARASPA